MRVVTIRGLGARALIAKVRRILGPMNMRVEGETVEAPKPAKLSRSQSTMRAGRTPRKSTLRRKRATS